MHPGVGVDSGVGEVEEADSEGEGAEESEAKFGF